MMEPLHIQKNLRQCVICGHEFYAFPSANGPVHIGCFMSKVDTAKAYDEWAKENYGEYAVLNFGPTEQGGVPS